MAAALMNAPIVEGVCAPAILHPTLTSEMGAPLRSLSSFTSAVLTAGAPLLKDMGSHECAEFEIKLCNNPGIGCLEAYRVQQPADSIMETQLLVTQVTSA